MDIFGSVFGGVLKHLDPVEVAKGVFSQVSGPVAAKALTGFFNDRMTAAARVALGDHLIKAGTFLKAGQVAKASDELGHVIGEIKL